jgi:hypothetical protein
MKKFILFFRGGAGTSDAGSWASWVEGLKQKGIFVDGAPLIKNGRIVSDNGQTVRDFVFDIADNARGFLVINAKDIDDAIVLTKDCPVFAAQGNITIRPIEGGY